MLVNYKKANLLVVEMGVGVNKLQIVPGINVIDDKLWDVAKKNLADKINDGIIVPIEKTVKKGEKETKESISPDEIPEDKIDAVVNEIQSEKQAEKFVQVSKKESVRAKGMNRKNAIAKEIAERESK